MTVPQYRLFLGFCVDEKFQESLDKIPDELKMIFIGDDENYLQKVMIKENTYLGKFPEDKSNLQNLRNIEQNIYSILSRLVPDYPCKNFPLRIFPAKLPVVSDEFLSENLTLSKSK